MNTTQGAQPATTQTTTNRPEDTLPARLRAAGQYAWRDTPDEALTAALATATGNTAHLMGTDLLPACGTVEDDPEWAYMTTTPTMVTCHVCLEVVGIDTDEVL
jgi:hypothetical protein